MKITLPLVSASAALLLSFQMHAEEKSNSTLINSWLREQSSAPNPWDLGGQVRLRVEHKEYFATPGTPAVDFQNVGGNADNSYLLSREKFHLSYKATDWATIFAEARDSRSYNDERSPDPERDPLDLQQAYVVLGNAKQFPVLAKIGRQELIYGDERLVGASDWSNLGRVFDAVKLRYDNPNFWVDGFASRLVMTDPHEFNVANDYDTLSGVYGSTRTIVPRQETQLYFLARNTGPNSPNAIGTGLPPFMTGASPRDIYTLGARIKSLPGEFGGWDYGSEMAGQLGNFKASSGKRLDQEAFALHVAGGYTWTNAYGAPRAGLEYNYGSGDSNPNDGKHGTFDNLFPSNHKFYGYMDFCSWQNIHDVRLTSAISPLKGLVLNGDYHTFWLASQNDFFYQVTGSPRTKGGYGINPGAGSYVGSEIDLIATYYLGKCSVFQCGYGHFFVGDYVKNSIENKGGATDANWTYLQATLNF